MEPEIQAALIGVAVALGSGLIGWMFSIHAKVSTIAEALKGITQLWDRAEAHEERLGRHEERLERHEQRIEHHAQAITEIRAGS